MNKKVNIDKAAIKLLYSRYKDYAIPVAIILSCVLIFIYGIIPQVQNITNLRIQEKEEARKLEILQNNLNLLSGLDSKTLDNQVRLVSKTLPTEKDFIGILNGVAAASQKANVTLGDYGFQVGDISSAPTKVKSIPNIELSLTVTGDLDNLVRFAKELSNTLPLSEIKAISLANKDSTLDTVFYYKPLPPLKIRDDVALSPLSVSVTGLLTKLSGMNNAKIEYIEKVAPTLNSSPSAVFSSK